MIQQNKLPNKFIVLFCAMLLIFVIACNTVNQSAAPTPVPTFDLNSVGVIIVKTANAASTQTAIHTTLSPSVTPSPSPAISPEAFPTTAPTTTPSPYTFGSFKTGDPTATPLGSDITDLNFIEGVKIYDEGIKINDKKNFEKVIPLMNVVIETNSNLAPPYRYRGVSYWFLGQCDKSLADLNQALLINPNYAAAWAGRGLTNDCLGNQTQMLLDYQTALSIDPSLAFVHHNLGVYYLEQGDYERTLEEYTISVSIDPNRAGAWSGRAEALFKLGRYEECILNADKALEINPEEWLAYSDRAYCEDFTGNYSASIKDYQIFLGKYEANAGIWYNLGLDQKKTGDLEGAVISSTKSLDMDPSYYSAYINRGNAYVLLEKYNEALADFNKALESGEIPLAYAGRGDAYHGLKEYDKAIKDYKKALTLDPYNLHPSCFLSLSYFEVEKYQDSIDTAQILSSLIDPDCGEQRLYETEARSYYALENYEQGVMYMDKALALGEYSLGHYYRGIIYQAAGKKEEAIQDLELFLSSVQPPESYQDKIADAKARLAQLK